MDKNDLRILLNHLLWFEEAQDLHPHHDLILFTCHVLMILHQSKPRVERDNAILFTISMKGGKVLDSVSEKDLNTQVAQMLKAFTVYAASIEPEAQKSAALIVKKCCLEILLYLKQLQPAIVESTAFDGLPSQGSTCTQQNEVLSQNLSSLLKNLNTTVSVDPVANPGNKQLQGNSRPVPRYVQDENRRPQRRKMPLVFRKKKPFAKSKVVYEEPDPPLSTEYEKHVEINEESSENVHNTTQCQKKESETKVPEKRHAPETPSVSKRFEHVEKDDDDFSPVPLATRLKQRGYVSKGRIPWSVEEVEFLVKHYPKYKHRYDVWRAILDKGADVFHESRTNVSLKDKWRQLGHSFR